MAASSGPLHCSPQRRLLDRTRKETARTATVLGSALLHVRPDDDQPATGSKPREVVGKDHDSDVPLTHQASWSTRVLRTELGWKAAHPTGLRGRGLASKWPSSAESGVDGQASILTAGDPPHRAEARVTRS